MSTLYTEIIQDAYKYPAHRGAVELHTHEYEDENPLCGDRIRVELRIVEDRIVEARFDGQGCAISQAAAELLLDRVQGQTIEGTGALTRDDVLEDLGLPTISPARLKCALLALGVLRIAIANGPRSTP